MMRVVAMSVFPKQVLQHQLLRCVFFVSNTIFTFLCVCVFGGGGVHLHVGVHICNLQMGFVIVYMFCIPLGTFEYM